MHVFKVTIEKREKSQQVRDKMEEIKSYDKNEIKREKQNE